MKVSRLHFSLNKEAGRLFHCITVLEKNVLGRCGSFARNKAFTMSLACFACDWAQKSMSVHEEESSCDLILGRKAAVYSGLLQSSPTQFFTHARDTVCSSVPSQTPSSCVALHHLNLTLFSTRGRGYQTLDFWADKAFVSFRFKGW